MLCLLLSAARCRVGIEKRSGLKNHMSSSAPQDTTNLLKFEVMQITAPYCVCIQTYFENNYRPEFERFVVFSRYDLTANTRALRMFLHWHIG